MMRQDCLSAMERPVGERLIEGACLVYDMDPWEPPEPVIVKWASAGRYYEAPRPKKKPSPKTTKDVRVWVEEVAPFEPLPTARPLSGMCVPTAWRTPEWERTMKTRKLLGALTDNELQQLLTDLRGRA